MKSPFIYQVIYSDCINKLKDSILEPSKKIYHYTSTDVLDKILSKATMHASNINFLNDSSEFKLAKKSMGEKDENTDLRSIEPYVISFSDKDNLLNQWISYAKESGVSIGFDFSEEVLEKICINVDSEQNAICTSVDLKPYKLKYFENENYKQDFDRYKEKLNEVSSKWISGSGKNGTSELSKELAIQLMAAYYKNEDFKNESESRFVFLPLESPGSKSKISFKSVSRGILRPYLTINCTDFETDKCGWPIVSITIGPSSNQDAVFRSVIQRVDNGNTNIFNFTVDQKETAFKDFLNVVLKENYQISDEDLNKTFIPKLRQYFNNEPLETKVWQLEPKNQQIFKKLISENYFSFTYGIWIKKSTTTYIY